MWVCEKCERCEVGFKGVCVCPCLAVNSTVPPLPAEGSVPPSVRPETAAAGVPDVVLMAAAATSLWRRETRCWTDIGGREQGVKGHQIRRAKGMELLKGGVVVVVLRETSGIQSNQAAKRCRTQSHTISTPAGR